MWPRFESRLLFEFYFIIVIYQKKEWYEKSI